MIRSFLLLATAILCLVEANCQTRLKVGQWKDHFSFNQILSITSGAGKVYAAGEVGISVYNLNDNSVSQIGKVEGLSDIRIAALAFDENSNTLVIGYENGNIDLVKGNEITNAPHIISKGIIGSTRINEITISADGKAYFATDFGITVLDIETGLNLDSYIFQSETLSLLVKDVALFNDSIFAATNQGIWFAPNNGSVNLADFRNWKQDLGLNASVRNLEFNQIEAFEDKLVANHLSGSFQDTLYARNINTGWNTKLLGGFYEGISLKANNNELLNTRKLGLDVFNSNLEKIRTENVIYPNNEYRAGVKYQNQLWMGLSNDGLVRIGENSDDEQITSNSPQSNIAFRLNSSNDDALFITGGGYTEQRTKLYKLLTVSKYHQGVWSNYGVQQAGFADSLRDAISITPISANTYFINTWGDGVLKVENEAVVATYTKGNATPLDVRAALPSEIYAGFSQLDNNGNLWVANSYTEDLLKVLEPNGTWSTINLGNTFGETATSVITDFIITSNNQVWLTKAGNGLFVFQFANNFKDVTQQLRKNLGTTTEAGNLPNLQILSVAEDLNGDVWVGTAKGPAVFYSPEFLFDEGGDQAQQIFIEQDGNVQIVLETEQINDIEIDGGNRKWFATNSGLFVFSPDVTEQIAHYTAENSPLLNNQIDDIELLKETGEIFIATANGLQSFKTNTTAGKESISELNVYPNPVRPDYFGDITMDGFVRDTKIKITDVEGRLIQEIESVGGRATWNMSTQFGNQIGSGVYLILATNEDGSEKIVDRVLVIRN